MVKIQNYNSLQFFIDGILYDKKYYARPKNGKYLQISCITEGPNNPILYVDWTEVTIMTYEEETLKPKTIQEACYMLNADIGISKYIFQGIDTSIATNEYFIQAIVMGMMENPDFLYITADALDNEDVATAVANETNFPIILAQSKPFVEELAKNASFVKAIANNTTFITALCGNDLFKNQIKLITGTGGVTE